MGDLERNGPSLTERTVSGVKWNAATQIGRHGTSFVVLAVLASIIPTRAFGQLAQALVVLNLFNLVATVGIVQAIVVEKKLSEGQITALFCCAVGLAFAASAFVYLLANPTAAYYGEPVVAQLLRGYTIVYPIASVGIVPLALLQRRLNFRLIGICEMSAVVLSGAISIPMALAGFGVWALLVQQATVWGGNSLLLFIAGGWRPRSRPDFHGVGHILITSRNVLASGFANYFSRHVDQLLIGKYLGADILGYYSMGYRFLAYPLLMTSGVMGNVLLPALSKVQDDLDRFRKAYLRAIRLTAMIAFPVLLGLFMVAGDFLFLIWKQKWLASVFVIQVLAIAGLYQCLASYNGNVYLVRKRSGLLLAWSFVVGILVALFTILGLPWGLGGVVLANFMLNVLVFYPAFAIPLSLIGLRVSRMLTEAQPSLINAGSMVIVIALVDFVCGQLDMHVAASLMLKILAGAGTYGACVLLRQRKALDDFMQLLRKKTV